MMFVPSNYMFYATYNYAIILVDFDFKEFANFFEIIEKIVQA
jgi:hypothetical protein